MRKILTILFFLPLLNQAQVKIPLDYRRFIQENDPVDGNLAPLIDGNTSTFAFMGYSQILNPSNVIYEFPSALNDSVQQIKFYGQGTDAPHPDTIWGVEWNSWTRVQLAILAGQYTTGWNTITLSRKYGLRYLIITKWYAYGGHQLPSELELWGSYNAGYVEPPLAPLPKLNWEAINGTNVYQWWGLQNAEDGSINNVPYLPKFDILNAWHVYRHFLDWKWIEPDSALYTFAPTKEGQFYLDTLYKHIAEQGGINEICLKIPPAWMVSSWSTNTGENIECHGYDDITDPASFKDFARACAVLTRRYGRNTNAALATQYQVQSGQPYVGQPVNTIRIGLGTVHKIMVGNESDRYWRGIIAYRTGRQYAAQLAPAYDSIKAVDPTMIVVMVGTANPHSDFMRGVVEWCLEHRAAGAAQLPFDEIDYHDYSNDAGGVQNGIASKGVAPEVGGMDARMDEMLWASQTFANSKPVLISETAGFDLNMNSPQCAHNIGNKPVQDVQADWDIRTHLLCWYKGIAGMNSYQVFDDQTGGYGTYQTDGKANYDLSGRTSWEYTMQMNKLCTGWARDTLLSTNPYIFRIKNGSNYRYILWSGTENGTVVSQSVATLLGTTYAKVWQLTPGQTAAPIAFPAATTPLSVNESPMIIEGASATQTFTPPTANAGADIVINRSSSLYEVTLRGVSTGTGKVTSWKKISGPEYGSIIRPYADTTRVNYLAAGVFKFQMKVCNDFGQLAYDTVQVTVNPPATGSPIPPVAHITTDYTPYIQTKNNFAWLKGTTSTDPDGSIFAYKWRRVSGPITYNIDNVNASETRFDNMWMPGYYTYELQVLDYDGNVGTDRITLTVLNPDGSVPPVPVFQLMIKRRLKLN